MSILEEQVSAGLAQIEAKSAEHLLSALYLSPGLGPIALDHLPDETFMPHKHRRAYKAMLKYGLAKGELDLARIEPHLDPKLINTVYTRADPKPDDIDGYAKRIRNCHDIRGLANSIDQFDFSPEKDAGEIVAELGSILEKGVKGTSKFSTIGVAAKSAYDRVDQWQQGIVTDYVSTGLKSLDKFVGGFPSGEITIIAGHTGGCKTQFMVDNLVRTGRARLEKTVVVFSCEMSKEKISHRIATRLSRIAQSRLRRNDGAPASEYNEYRKALVEQYDWNIIIDDTPSPTPEYMASVLKRVQLSGGLHMFWVDYLEKVRVKGMSAKDGEARVAAIVESLKNVAKTLDVPGVILSQYNREAQNHYNFGKKPSNRFLRSSGKVEQEANTIIHIHVPSILEERGADNVYPYSDGYAEEPNDVFFVVTKCRDDSSFSCIRAKIKLAYGAFADTKNNGGRKEEPKPEPVKEVEVKPEPVETTELDFGDSPF